MRELVRRIPLALCPLVLAFPPLSAQTSTVANVYIQGKSGVYVFDANSSGQLTPVKGSPFSDIGQMEGINGAYLISVGTSYLHSYHLASSGAVGSHAARMNTQNYSGNQCGPTAGPSLLDHTGKYFSVVLFGASNTNGCAALQTYKIASSGQFTFLGDSVNTDGVHGMAYGISVSTYSSNDLFAYGVQGQQAANLFLAFRRAPAGDLVVNSQFTYTAPQPDPPTADNDYWPMIEPAADASGHLAAVLERPFDNAYYGIYQLGSFTINSTTGAISSTNTSANMPVLKVYPGVLRMSWSGNLLAVGGVPGLQLFHFNGAAPPTTYSNVLLPNVQIDHLAWDKSNHLYVLSYSSQLLYVYTVTTTSIKQAAGSPYKINSPYGWVGMIVVPKV